MPISHSLPILVLAAALMAGPVAADDAAGTSAEPAMSADGDTRELFLRCCWALGRAGFHFCKEYGVCASDTGATCTGVGAAEGMTAACAVEPPDLPDTGG